MSVRPPATVAVAGSCVTRDNFNRTFNPSYKDHFEVVVSANQSSMIALMSPPITEDFTPTRTMSDYDRWNVGNDLRREFLTEVVEAQPAYLILDFFGDVHFGVAQLPDGRYLTDNRWKTRHTDLYDEWERRGMLTRLHWTGDPEQFFATWVRAMDSFAELVRTQLPSTRVIVHRGWNAGRVRVPGRPRPIPLRRHVKTAALDVEAANAFWARLDDHAVSAYGWAEIDLRSLEAPSYAEHPWGPFWVHYTPDYYHRFLAELLKVDLRTRLTSTELAALALIEEAAAQPDQRRLEVLTDVVQACEERLARVRERVQELEGLSPARALRFAVGQRVRRRRGRQA